MQLTIPETLYRDTALARVLANAGPTWQAKAIAVLNTMQGEFTGEDLRIECESQGVKPHHPNAWGSIIGNLKRAGEIVETGELRKM